MIGSSLRQFLCVAVLVSLALPGVVSAAIAVHEAEHHSTDTPEDSPLLVALHGHHHDHEVQEHEHHAVPRAHGEFRAESQPLPVAVLGTFAAERVRELRRRAAELPPLDPLAAPELSVWRL